MLLIGILLTINFLTHLPIYGKQFHDYMTKEEKVAIFGVGHDKVHTAAYKVVPLFARSVSSKKSARTGYKSSTSEFEKRSVYLETFGENFDLYLEENKNTLFGDRTPIIIPYLNCYGNIKYDKKIYDLIPQLKIRAYHNRNKKAAVTIDEDDNGRINVNGHVNHKIIIRSIPERLHKEVLSKYPNLTVPFSGYKDKTGESHHHIIIKKDNPNNARYTMRPKSTPDGSEKKSAGLLKWNKRLPKRWRFRPTISPSDLKEFTVYPKILVILDYPTYLSHHKNLVECVRHAIAYWNAVDLRFREFEKPKIRLNIAGIIVATKPNVTPYLEKQKASDNSIYDRQTLNDLVSYFEKENVTHVDYDIVVVLSPWGLVNGDLKWWRCIKNWITNTEPDALVEGISDIASICKYPRRAMAIVKNGGDMFDTNVAAHEIGHILGAMHDPEKLRKSDPNFKSDWKHGYIMSYLRINTNQMHWSDASISSIQQNLQTDKGNHCLLRKPKVGTPYKKILPGKIMSRDEQCQIQFGKLSYSHKDSKFLSDCLSSYCYSPTDHTYFKIGNPVVDGTYCNKDKICIEGHCVRDPTDPTVYQNF